MNGGTFQTDGTTLVNGATVMINNTATLMGSGSLLSSAIVDITAGGSLAPGSSIGTLTAGNVSFRQDANFTVELGSGNSSDLLSLPGGGNLNFETNSILRLHALGGPEDPDRHDYIIATVNDGATDILVDGIVPANTTLGNLTVGGASNGPVEIDTSAMGLPDGTQLDLYISGNDVVLTVTAAPEPMSITLIATAGLGALGWVRRRSKRKNR